MDKSVTTKTSDIPSKNELTADMVRKYLVRGQGAVTDQEVGLFLGYCRSQGLDPFSGDVYIIKYSSSQPASIVIGRDGYLRRARSSQDYRGHQAGIICAGSDGSTKRTLGIIPPNHTLVGGWAEVYIDVGDGHTTTIAVEVNYSEYESQRSPIWREKPCTMVRKVALSQALREAFPSILAGAYAPEEIGYADSDVVTVRAHGHERESTTPPTPQSQLEVQTPPGPSTTIAPRRRRHKWQVDRAVYGSATLTTCGATPEQLLQIKRSYAGRADELRALLIAKTGYDQLSYLTEDEAWEIINTHAEVHQTPNASESDGDVVDMPNEAPAEPEEELL